MTALPCFNLETRRDAFAATVDLETAEELIDLVAFEAPEEVVESIAVSLVSHAAELASGAEIGWRQGATLADRASVKAGGRLALAVRKQALARLVAARRLAGGPEAATAIPIAFSTLSETPRGLRASPRRTAQVTALAGASRPQCRLEPLAFDLEAAPAGETVAVAEIAIDVPDDVVLEVDRYLIIDAGCGDAPAAALTIAAADPAAPPTPLTRRPDPAPDLCRFALRLPDAQAVAGRTIRFRLLVARDALLDVVDGLVAARHDGGLQARLAAKLSGWGEAQHEDARRRWTLALDARTLPPPPGGAETSIAVAGGSARLPENGQSIALETPALTIEIEPDDEFAPAHVPPVTVDVSRWPLSRGGPIAVRVSTSLSNGAVREPPAELALTIVRKGAAGRSGRAHLPMRELTDALSRMVRSSGGPPARGLIEVELVAPDDGGRPFAKSRTPLAFIRKVRRLPIYVDFGGSSVAVWAAEAAPDGQAARMRPLALGDWLRRQTGAPDVDAGVLIPSAIGLDPRNGLRQDWAPHTLRSLDLLGADRAAAGRRMAALGRRFDVSLPAPPERRSGLAPSRVVHGLFGAIASGVATLDLGEAVLRRDGAAGRLTNAASVETAALAADALDELIDLYVMRLMPQPRDADHAEPAPVAPHVTLTRPSGLGDEIERRLQPMLDLFAARLERLFPGVADHERAVTTVPAGPAAARFLATRLKPAPTPGDALLVALDVGASACDAALCRLSIGPDGVTGFETLAAFSLPAGGDRLDLALEETVAAAADAAMASESESWRPNFGDASLAGARRHDDPTALAVRARLKSAIRSAKIDLAARLAARAEAAGDAYRWSDGAVVEVALATGGADGSHDGLYAPVDTPRLGEGAAASGLALTVDKDGGYRLTLRLSRAALEGGPAREALAAAARMGGLLVKFARAAAPAEAVRPRTIVAAVGRGALWPPFYEAVAAEAAAGRCEFPFPRPFAPETMKQAAVAGAATLDAEGGLADARPAARNPLALAALSPRTRDLDGQGLAAAYAVDRVAYLGCDREKPGLSFTADLGRRFQFVRALPGLDPQGRALTALRQALGGAEPIAPLDGEATADAGRERIDRFGLCEITVEPSGTSGRKVVVVSEAEGWEACWKIEDERATRVY